MNFKMPKSNADLKNIIPALKVVVESGVDGIDRKRYQSKLIETNSKYSDRDESTRLNLLELWRYVGFVKEVRKKKIFIATENGVKFFNLFIAGKEDEYRKLFIWAALKGDYSSENGSVKNISNISMPHALFSLLALGELTKFNLVKFLNYLLIVEDVSEGLNYKDASNNLNETIRNKLNDNKFFILLKNLGIIWEKNGVWELYDKSIIIDKYKFEIFGERFVPLHGIVLNYAYDEMENPFDETSKGRKSGLTYNAIKKALHKCEHNHDHTTFIWKKDGKQYMEGHHLLQVEFSVEILKDKKYDVDVENNIFSLCPNCHSTFRSGTDSSKKELIDSLYNKRKEYYFSKGIDIEYVYNLYMINY